MSRGCATKMNCKGDMMMEPVVLWLILAVFLAITIIAILRIKGTFLG